MNGQAPKGGKKVSGVYYKGGQFLPSNDEPKHGKYNRKNKKTKKVRKQEIEPYVWGIPPSENHQSIHSRLSAFATHPYNEDGSRNHKVLEFCASEKTMNYFNKTRDDIMPLIDSYNSGERWYLPK